MSNELFDRPDWLDDAACAGTHPDVFFSTRGAPFKLAKAICADCPVKQECLDHALDEGIRFGIWGGLSERERRQLRRQRAAASIA